MGVLPLFHPAETEPCPIGTVSDGFGLWAADGFAAVSVRFQAGFARFRTVSEAAETAWLKPHGFGTVSKP
jgi:hypothetical protein